MKLFKVCLIGGVLSLLLTGGLASVASADQNDSRLDDLFVIIQKSEDSSAILNAENEIWQIWSQHDDQETQRRLAAGVRVMNTNLLEALIIFNKIIEEYPEFAESWNKRATLYYMMGDYTASVRDIEKTLELEPRHFGALSGLGLVYMAQDQYFKARSAFEEVLIIHPTINGARQNLKMISDYIRRTII